MFQRGWPGELLTHFRPQQMWIALVLAGGFWAGKQPRSACVCLALVLLIAAQIGYPMYRAYRAPALSPPENAPLTVVFFNTGRGSMALQTLVETLDPPPDLLLLAEVTDPVSLRPGAGKVRYPHRRFHRYGNVFGVGILSRFPITQFRPLETGIAGEVPWAEGTVVTDRGKLDFWVVHPPRPTDPKLFRFRNRMLAAMVRAGRGPDPPDVLAGDFNCSPGSPYFQDLVDRGGWIPAGRANPFRFTWPAGRPFLGTAIDHVFVSGRWRVNGFSVLPRIPGSDHHPVQGRISR